jgi:hypothetical protein
VQVAIVATNASVAVTEPRRWFLVRARVPLSPSCAAGTWADATSSSDRLQLDLTGCP